MVYNSIVTSELYRRLIMVTSLYPQDLNILIVEDDEDTAEVVSTVLESAGFRTVAVSKGQAAIDSCLGSDARSRS